MVRAEGGRLRAAALAALAGGDRASRPVNLSGRARREVVATPEGALRVVAVPALGAGEEVAAGDAVSVQRDGDRVVLVNGALRATLAPGGDLVGLVHRPTGREALSGPAAVFELYDDRPAAWDAWDLDPSHLETGRAVGPATSCTVTAEGPLRAEVVFERPLSARSHLRETVRLDAHAARLEVHCEVDWHDQHRALKVAVPVAVRSTTATFEMQFGVAERPTHYNTPGDLARFEVPAHRFADLSEHGFGVALLSESKYGFSAHGDTLRMTLLRGPVWPDPQADQGRHAFAFALLPHAGGWQDAGVVHERARVQPAAPLGRPPRAGRGVAGVRGRRPRPRHGQARRGRRRARRAPVRGPRGARHGRAAPRPARVGRAPGEPPRGSGRGAARAGRTRARRLPPVRGGDAPARLASGAWTTSTSTS